MDENLDDQLSNHIGNKLRAHTTRSSDSCIFRVPRHLRNVNEEAYAPLVVAIGPYHYQEGQLMGIKEHKLHCLKMLLQRRGEDNVKRYIVAMRSMEGRARSFYAEALSDLQTNEFVEMMLLDSCFIFELIRQIIVNALTENYNPIFDASCTYSAVIRDLFLVENQLPLFVLMEFFDMTKMPNEEIFNDFGNMIFVLFHCMLPPGVKILNQQALDNHECIQNSRHLLGLLHTVCLPPFREIEEEWEFIPSATKLKEAGIKFKKAEETAEEPHSLFDINFENGVLKIPTLRISHDGTESFFRNLIAYEQFFSGGNSYFADYTRFIDCLINSREDVALLCGHGIIDNWLGDEKVVADMFNKLRDNITYEHNFYYSKLFNQVNKYRVRPCNRWMANLKHKYFNSPWALISLLAAIFLLLLTVAQTVFSVLAYFKC